MENTRRDFFKKVIYYTSAGVLVHVMAKSVTAYAADPKLIDMTEKKRKDPENLACKGVATSLGYVEDLSKSLKDKKITKSDKTDSKNKVWKISEQNCKNCNFFNFKKENPAVPNCQLIQGCFVHENGSCNSWTPPV